MNKHTSITHSRLKIVPAFLILGALLLIASACTAAAGGSSVASAPPAAQATSIPQAAATSVSQAATSAAPGNPPPAGSPRDVNSMNACALFPGDKLASALNTTLTDPSNLGAGIGPQCTYSFGATGTGDGTNLLYNLFLMPPELYTPSLNGMMNSQPVAGMGDMASMGTRVGTNMNDLMVLKSGDIAIEINGTDPTILKNMASYILAHLP